MGAWGYGYRDNDNYYNEVFGYVDPIVDGLFEYVNAYDSLEDVRARLMWTFNVLSKTEEEVPLTGMQLEKFRAVVSHVRIVSHRNAGGWRDDNEYLVTVEKELAQVEEWLDSFTKSLGFLEDRAGALLEAVSKRESKDEREADSTRAAEAH